MSFNKPHPATQKHALMSSDPRWAHIVARDHKANGKFWFSVSTTGIYCCPSCPSRRAKPENIRIHESVAEARAAGLQPCQRCNPDGLAIDARNLIRVVRACRLLEESERSLPLSTLAEAVALSPSHFHRLFTATTGVTPKHYAVALQAARLRDALSKAPSITAAIYDAGYNSSGRFYEMAKDILGMTPTTYRAGGANEKIRFAVGETSLGSILVASSEQGIVSILIGDDPAALLHNLQNRFSHAHLIGADAGYEALIARVVGLVDAPQQSLDLPLDIRGTAFQQRVWHTLRKIPPGKTASYTDIAKMIGAPAAVRAVARACAANHIAIAIPCHRVVRKDGSISGYAWGIERKRTLLAKEAKT